MKLFNKMLFAAAMSSLFAGLGGCASELIDVRAGSDHVSLTDANQVAGCQSKGKITVSVLAKVGFVSRSAVDVEGNLLQLARNAAVDAGGDSVVKEDSPEFGKQTFAIYKCRF